MSYLINTYINIRALLLFGLMMAICRTLRFEIEGSGWLDELKKKGKNVLFAVWHQATFVMFYLYRDQKACIVTTPEIRGRVLGKVAEWMGYQNITLPLAKEKLDAARGFAKLLKLVRKGYDAVIAVDGPNGPLYEVKPGATYLSTKGNLSIIPVGVKAPWKLTFFWRWDKYFVPLPFSKVQVKLGQPIRPGETLKLLF